MIDDLTWSLVMMARRCHQDLILLYGPSSAVLHLVMVRLVVVRPHGRGRGRSVIRRGRR